jgi:predicted nucleic acid-binding Zn ribbon protein
MAFVALSSALDRTLKQYRLSGDLEAYKVFTLWEELVGQKMAGHAKPSRITNSILYVEVDDPVWLTQIRYMKSGILTKIESQIKKGALKDLRFYLQNS